jgi:predicted Zn-dependent peptidase
VNAAPRLRTRHKPTEQAHICLAYPGVPNGHPDQYTMDLVSAMLGDGMSSRLFLELREERALVYDVHSYSSEYRDAGALTVYAGCDPEGACPTIEATFDVIDAFASGVSQEELAMAKRMLTGRLQLRMEDTRTVAGWLGSQELLLGEVLTIDEAIARIEAVTLDDVRRIISTHLPREKTHLAIVGPFEDDEAFRGYTG